LALKPDWADALCNLGRAWKATGRLDEAIACFRRALALEPLCVSAHDNLLNTLHYDPAWDMHSIFAEHVQWNRLHAEPLQRLVLPHANERDPMRRLRIGYVSPDFRHHPGGRFILPLLESHDRRQVEVFGYCQLAVPDQLTAKLRSHTDTWRNITALSDQQAAELIRQDRIDILVDLAGHTADNRLLVFARKPAPVQVTYLGYPTTTGLAAIDYRLSDRYLKPDQSDDSYFTEKSICLEGTYWCYEPSLVNQAVNELPALSAKTITLGCLNNFCKVSPAALETWAGLLNKLDDSRLVLHSGHGSHRERVIRLMADRGIAADRLEIVGRVSPEEYFKTYQRIDIALDPFPFAGGTTTCDALWMGVPVVTLAGRTVVGRAGVSILSNVGLPELIARTPEDYVKIAVDLAGDMPRLAELRSILRRRMEESPLMDKMSYARGIEAAYRAMWRTWCAS